MNFLEQREQYFKTLEGRWNLLTEQVVQSKPHTNFESGERIIAPNKSQKGQIGLIRHGVVKKIGLLNPQLNTQHRTIDLYGPTDWIGIEAILSLNNFYIYHAATEVDIILMGVEDLMTERQLDLFELILAKLVRDQHDRDFEFLMTTGDTRTRVLICLMNLRKRLPGEYEIPITLSDIADMCRTGKSRVSPIMKSLELEGLVARAYGHYSIGEWELLAEALLPSSGPDK